jgi:predicted HTH domain antitoxin
MMDETEKAGIPLNYTTADLQLDLKAIKKEG